VAAHTWIGYESLFMAKNLGWWPEAQARLTLTGNATESMAALQSGQAQAAALTLDEVLRGRSIGLPLIVVLVFDVSSGADMLLTRTRLPNLQALRGARVGVEPGAVGALFLDAALSTAGLPPDAVQRVAVPPDHQLALWSSGELDAVVTYEPQASALRKAGAFHLFDSRQTPDTIFDVLAVLESAASRQNTALRAVLAAHFKALEHIRTHSQDALYRMAAREGVPKEDVEAALRGIEPPDVQGNRSYLSADQSHLMAATQALMQVMVRQHQLAHPLPLDGLLDPHFLPAPGASN
jgi:NitT/TauT family transport system substrate-binding protein